MEIINFDFKNRIIKKKKNIYLNELSNYGKRFNLKSKNSYFNKNENFIFGKSNNLYYI